MLISSCSGIVSVVPVADCCGFGSGSASVMAQHGRRICNRCFQATYLGGGACGNAGCERNTGRVRGLRRCNQCGHYAYAGAGVCQNPVCGLALPGGGRDAQGFPAAPPASALSQLQLQPQPQLQPQGYDAGILLRADLDGTLDAVTRVAARRDATLAGRVTLITFGMQEAGSYFVRTWMGPHASALADLHPYLHRTDWLCDHTTRLPRRGTWRRNAFCLTCTPSPAKDSLFVPTSSREIAPGIGRLICFHVHMVTTAASRKFACCDAFCRFGTLTFRFHVYHLDHTSAAEVDRMSHDDHEEYLQEPRLRLWMNPPATLLHDWRHR